jgi:hypothetical protein
MISVAIWVRVMLLTRPESDEKLDEFYRRVRPGGPGWRRQRERTGIPPAQSLAHDLQRIAAALLLLFGLMFGVGSAVLLRWGTMGAMAAVARVGAVWLCALGAPQKAPPAPEPRTHPVCARPRAGNPPRRRGVSCRVREHRALRRRSRGAGLSLPSLR